LRRLIAAAGLIAAPALVVGCSDDGGGKSAGPPTNVHTVSLPTVTPSSGTALPAPPSSAAGPEPSASAGGKPSSPSASGSGKATSRSPGATTTKPRTSAPAAGPPAKFQGTWYYPRRDATGAVVTLTVSGGAISVALNGNGCSGTISATAYVTMTCKGDVGKGQASVSSNGQTLTIAWVDDAAEQFVRTRP
jgi:hypothetical protein